MLHHILESCMSREVELIKKCILTEGIHLTATFACVQLTNGCPHPHGDGNVEWFLVQKTVLGWREARCLSNYWCMAVDFWRRAVVCDWPSRRVLLSFLGTRWCPKLSDSFCPLHPAHLPMSLNFQVLEYWHPPALEAGANLNVGARIVGTLCWLVVLSLEGWEVLFHLRA